MIDPELGTVRLCPRCDEWWPLDVEFWYRQRRNADGFGPWCKACVEDGKRVRRA